MQAQDTLREKTTRLNECSKNRPLKRDNQIRGNDFVSLCLVRVQTLRLERLGMFENLFPGRMKIMETMKIIADSSDSR